MAGVRCWLALCLWSAVASAAPVVVLFPALGAPRSVTLSGRVLARAPSDSRSTFGRNLRRFTGASAQNVEVSVTWAERTAVTRTDEDGDFRVTFEGTPAPFSSGFSVARARVDGGLPGTAMVHVVSKDSAFFVVSDFDDTLAVTNVATGPGALRAAFWQDERSQPVVAGMPGLLSCLVDEQPGRGGLAIVSGSPLQFVTRVHHFLEGHAFPAAALYLRELSPSTMSNYKQPLLRELLARVPQPVVLIGDSGEHDPEVYAEIRREFPDRVKAIYIHHVTNDPPSRARYEGMVVFDDPKDAARDAVARGLTSASCVARTFPGGTP